MPVVLPNTSQYTQKDQAKANRANKFIGRGSARSSTAAYALAFGSAANCGVYSANDVVMVSAEGKRSGRFSPDYAELSLAIKAGATLLTDNEHHRNRFYNVGERQVVAYLRKNGYEEKEPGLWRPV